MKIIITTSLLFSIINLQTIAQIKSNSTLKTFDYTFTNMIAEGMYSPSLSAIKYISFSKKK